MEHDIPNLPDLENMTIAHLKAYGKERVRQRDETRAKINEEKAIPNKTPQQYEKPIMLYEMLVELTSTVATVEIALNNLEPRK